MNRNSEKAIVEASETQWEQNQNAELGLMEETFLDWSLLECKIICNSQKWAILVKQLEEVEEISTYKLAFAHYIMANSITLGRSNKNLSLYNT